MPNWCSVTYKVTGEQKQVKKLAKIITKLSQNQQPKIRNGFGNLWLGEVVNALRGNWENIRCRGEIIDFDSNGEVLTLYQETAWTEQREFRHFLESKLPGIKIYYIEEEPGCEVYTTNDKNGQFFDVRYLLDSSKEGEEYYTEVEDIAKAVSEMTGIDIEPNFEAINQALEQYNNDAHEDEFIYLHEFEICDD